MFSIWNENLKPETVKDFGDEYICSTAVVTLLYFGGFESDSTPRREFDLITPFQVVRARGPLWIIPLYRIVSDIIGFLFDLFRLVEYG